MSAVGPSGGSTVTGRVDVVQLPLGSDLRAVRVYLPPDYEDSQRVYPVLYMFDGHNLFDAATSRYGKEWRIDESMAALHAADPGLTAVVVGLDSAPDPLDRYAEYSISDWIYPGGREGASGTPIRAMGRITADFLIGVVKPWVEQRYRVASDRSRVGIGGSSMGGYQALFVGALRPDLFGVVLAWSPAVLERPMHGEVLRGYIADLPPGPQQRVYLDMGSAERLDYADDPVTLVRSLELLVAAVRSGGTRTVAHHVAAGDQHDEDAWARRFPAAFRWGFHAGPAPQDQSWANSDTGGQAHTRLRSP